MTKVEVSEVRMSDVTKMKIEDLKKSFNQKPNPKISAILQKSARFQIESLISELQIQVDEYESLKSEGVEAIQVHTLNDLLLIPIRNRIAKQMSQESFSHLVGVSVRQIARYKADSS
jgi:hypothetical protein